MTDLIAQFALLLKESEGEAGGSIDLVLANLAPGEAGLLRKTALTHQFTPEILRVLDPSLSDEESEKSFTRFSRLSAVMRTPDGLALHDRAREQLFGVWLRSTEQHEEFRAIHERLAAFIAARIGTAETSTRDKLLRRLIFHRVGVDQDQGIDQFEDEFERYRERLRFTAGETLLRLVREYAPIFTPRNRTRVDYREAKLAFDRGNNDRALELFTSVRDAAEGDAVLQAKAWYGIGLAYDGKRNWDKAINALQTALRVTEDHHGAGFLRCRIQRSLAAVYRDTGEIQKAEKYLRSAIELARESDDQRGLAAAFNAFGTVYHRANDPEKAVASLNASLEHLPPEDFDRARVYNNLGLAYLRMRNFEESERWFRRSLELKALGGDTLGQANTHLNLVRLFREESSFEKAAESAAAAAELFGSVFAWREAGDARATLARLLAERGDRDCAEAELGAAVEAYGRARADGDIALVRKQIQRALSGGRGRLPGGVRAFLTGVGIFVALSVALSLHECSKLAQ